MAGGAGGWDFSSMIIKIADNINRGVENATKAGEGANGNEHQIQKGNNIEGGDVSGSSSGVAPVTTDSQDMDSANNAAENMKALGSIGIDAIKSKANTAETGENTEETSSDERLKRIFGGDEDAIKAFAKIDSIMFKYNSKAKEIHPDGENSVDGDVHYGVKAQDLEKNPYTSSAVSEDNAGYKQVDTKELTMANSSVIAEICRRLLLIERVLGLEVK